MTKTLSTHLRSWFTCAVASGTLDIDSWKGCVADESYYIAGNTPSNTTFRRGPGLIIHRSYRQRVVLEFLILMNGMWPNLM
jgi:hypothetical protein